MVQTAGGLTDNAHDKTGTYTNYATLDTDSMVRYFATLPDTCHLGLIHGVEIPLGSSERLSFHLKQYSSNDNSKHLNSKATTVIQSTSI